MKNKSVIIYEAMNTYFEKNLGCHLFMRQKDVWAGGNGNVL